MIAEPLRQHSMYDWIDLNHAFPSWADVAMVVQWSDTSRFSFDQEGLEFTKLRIKVGLDTGACG